MNSQQALKKLIDYTRGETPVDLFRIIQQDIYKLEKLEKALEILVEELEISVIEDKQKYDFVYYWLTLNGIAEKEINKEKCELLKEVLGND